MKRTPEGSFFAGVQAFAYARRTGREIAVEVEQGSYSRGGLSLVIGGYDMELQKLLRVLANDLELSATSRREPRENPLALARVAWESSHKIHQPTIDRTFVYVALSVVENYVEGRTVTPEATDAFRQIYDLLTPPSKRGVEQNKLDFPLPPAGFDPGLLKEGVIFLKQEVKKQMTREELGLAHFE